VKVEYAQWIADYVAAKKVVVGACRTAVREMLRAFPELAEVRGWVETSRGRYEHAWLVTAGGEVVDPTASQFANHFAAAIEEYVPWKPGDEVKVGRCMNCGEDIFRAVESLDGDRAMFCGEACGDAAARELELEARQRWLA
jgi:hypothetical protein